MNKEEIQKLKDILWANTWDNEQIIDEGIATLKKSFNLKNEGFRRIESAGLLAIYTLQQQLEEKDKIINGSIDYTKNHFKEMVADEEAQELLEILEGGKKVC